ncbi:MAG TPA: pyridoxamine 5'-phosphate oxidase family protein [Steroidobacteraceae bacterium]|nr:pyridoxamine 5'-phosphate oxidase family protein [Steroidobacteraceae bacterium]
MDAIDDADAAQRLIEIVRGFETAMLVAADDDDLTRARPMMIVNRRSAPLPPHRMVFLTHRRNPLLANLDDDPYVCVTLQDRTRYVCLAGRATVDDDSLRIFSLWSREWDPWFPGGASDINAVLIDCRMSFAELWDPTGAPSQRFALHSGKILPLHPTVDAAAIGHRPALLTDVLTPLQASAL